MNKKRESFKISKILCLFKHDYRWYVRNDKPVIIKCRRCGKGLFTSKRKGKL